jgi:fatty-acyl-CoA synthase
VAYLGDYEALLGAAGEFEFPQVDEEAIATHFYTTGTTGLPKGVCYTHRQLVEHTLAVGLALASADDYQSLRVGDVYLPLTPMFHVHAWGMPYLATLLGLKQVYPGRFDPKTIPALIVREGITYSHCVPTILQMILDEARQQGMTFSGWKVMVGGSAMVPALASRALQAGIRVFAGYGMSETCPVVCFARADAALAAQSPADLCRVGQPVPLVDLRLWGDDVEDGELVARAPWLTRAYVKDEHGTERLWEGGYLHTGDVARIDDDGAVRIVDRLKDVIKSGGEWISSLELERLLREHGSVEEAAVIGVPDDRWGECPRAFVKLSAERAIADDTVVGELTGLLLEKVRIGTIPRFAIPKSFVIVEDIPKTSVGKIDKKRLRTWEDVPDEQR